MAKNPKNSVKIHIFAIMRMCINRGAKVPISGIMRSRLDSDIRRMCLSLNGYGTMFILDFFIRWNSTQLMIQRFQKLKKIVISLTTNACEIEGIKPKHLTNLNKWALSIQDWQLVNVLDIVLLPF